LDRLTAENYRTKCHRRLSSALWLMGNNKRYRAVALAHSWYLVEVAETKRIEHNFPKIDSRATRTDRGS